MISLVSCICPTADRRGFLPAPLRSYLAQDWPRKELIVIDDGSDAVEDVFSDVPDCVYIRLGIKQRIGVKRNLACEAARGEIICHWDDDDWSAASRISDQVERLTSSAKAVTGYHSLLFWDGMRGFKYQGGPDYALGSSLFYLKEFWRRHEFIAEDHRRYEDNVFVQAARDEKQIIAADGGKLMVARIHAGNTAPKRPLDSPSQWIPVITSDIPEEFFTAIEQQKGEHAHAV